MNEELEKGPTEEDVPSEDAALAELIEGQPPDEIDSAEFSVVGIGASAGGLEVVGKGSDLGRKDLKEAAASVGAVEYLAKPFRQEALLASVGRHAPHEPSPS